MDGIVYMDRIRNYMIKHEKLVGFLVGWIIIFADLLICNQQTAYCDSNGYDLMSNYFKNNGLFHFWIEERNEYTEYFSIRGYAWPFILAVCKVLGFGTRIGYWMFYAVFLASGLAYAMPEFISGLFQKKISIPGRIAAVILSVCFWNGLMKYPLSDIPSVVTVSWGLMLLTKIKKERRLYHNAAAAVLAGGFLGISYYVRSGCMPVIMLSVLIIFLYKCRKEILKKFVLILALCLGVAVAAVFTQENTGGLSIEYDIWSMEQKNNTYISLSGYVIALNKKSGDSRLTLVLSSDSRQYLHDINLTSNPYMEDPYIESKYSINKELVGMDEGIYQIGFLLKNGTETGVVFTGKEIQITK